MKRCLPVLLALLICGLAAAACADSTVGTDIAAEDITAFYYTVDSPFFLSEYLQYQFYAEDGKKYFYHESRQGSEWPQTEEDIAVSGSMELTDEIWLAFFDCLAGGTVKARSEEVLDGDSGPWTYLYWEGDNGKDQEFTFASLGQRTRFEELCSRLAQNHVLTRFYFSRGGYLPMRSWEIVFRKGNYYIPEDEDELRPVDPAMAEKLQAVIDKYDLESWNGFHESNPYVLDGEGFNLEISYADCTSVSASGDNAFPDNYYDASAGIEEIFDEETRSRIAGTYRYEGQGFGGEFTLTLNGDGTYTFSEGPLSSYLGGGTWYTFYNAVYMEEENGYDLQFMFGIQDDALIYIAAGSDEFPYVKAGDEERFIRMNTAEEDK